MYRFMQAKLNKNGNQPVFLLDEETLLRFELLLLLESDR
jgi:hypothetical protein